MSKKIKVDTKKVNEILDSLIENYSKIRSVDAVINNSYRGLCNFITTFFRREERDGLENFMKYFVSQKPNLRKNKQFCDHFRHRLYKGFGREYIDHYWWHPADVKTRLDFLRHLRKKRKN